MSHKDYSVEHNDFVSSSDIISKHVGYTRILLWAQLTFLYCLNVLVTFIFATKIAMLRTKKCLILFFCSKNIAYEGSAQLF